MKPAINFNIAISKNTSLRCPYFLGISTGKIAANRAQIRVGLIWWHFVISWTPPPPIED